MLRQVIILTVMIALLGSILVGFRTVEILSVKNYEKVKVVIEESN